MGEVTTSPLMIKGEGRNDLDNEKTVPLHFLHY